MSLKALRELTRLQSGLKKLQLALCLALWEVVEVVVLRCNFQQPLSCERRRRS